MRRAIDRQQLRMALSAQGLAARRRLRQVEALVRWDDPELGTVKPSRFIPFAEEHGLIDDLTQWGLRTILRQWLEWRDEGLDTCIAFNISALSLQHLDFPDLVERMCRALEVPTDRLVLELTEGATQPLVKLMDALTRFRIKGIGLAIDDFGTGYSSLMQLRQLPFTEVKIDQAFVADMPYSRDSPADYPGGNRARPRPRPDLDCRRRRDDRPAAAMRELGCDFVQGYLISPPMDPTRLKRVVRRVPPRLAGDDRRRETRAMGRCRSGSPGRVADLSRN